MTTEQTPAALAAEIKRLHHDYAKTRVPGPELFEAIDRLEALASAAQQITRVSIPTETMEQEFQSHYRLGFAAGKDAGVASASAAQGANTTSLSDDEIDNLACEQITYGDEKIDAFRKGFRLAALLIR